MSEPAKNENEPTNGKEPNLKTDKKTPVEIGGPKGPEPTRYNDWEKAGRCIDF